MCFFDLEGDPFCGEGGLEYLFGWVILNSQGEANYTAQWAVSREEEKGAFQAFVDFINARWQQYPDMHIYHFGGYEPGALKRLMGRYATREEDIDRMLRAGAVRRLAWRRAWAASGRAWKVTRSRISNNSMALNGT